MKYDFCIIDNLLRTKTRDAILVFLWASEFFFFFLKSVDSFFLS